MKTLAAFASATLLAMALAPSATAQGAPAGPPDETRLQLARSILDANGGPKAIEGQLRAVFSSPALRGALANQDPKIVAITEAVTKYALEEEIKSIPQLIDIMAAAYAENLSETELRDFLAWITSPSARAIQAKMPAITAQVMVAQAPLIRKMAAGAMMVAIDRECAQIKCTDEVRRQLTTVAQRSFPSS